MAKFAFESVVWPEGKYYVAQCLGVDVASYGKTKKEALSMLQDAVSLYLQKD